jgi:hypothetical protein
MADLASSLPAGQRMAFVAGPTRFAELGQIESRLPGGHRQSILRCGVNEIARVYVVEVGPASN